MLETLREFAADRLDEAGESGNTRAEHAACFVALVEREKRQFTGPDPGE